ncbi:hypothetical protein IG631_23353 [Alternaria alternata]|nr:hypothetical protein IG631_23353 [Alternaria alternata]
METSGTAISLDWIRVWKRGSGNCAIGLRAASRGLYDLAEATPCACEFTEAVCELWGSGVEARLTALRECQMKASPKTEG